ncbi:hypothetical protein FIBSPDRAFT_860733 [Athelia psychrophila]|uniref:Sds3-like-domain-containing protein n=1 Tax=Athelia psychrophila TaxID=1759441 RepID=A0A166JWB8_9AGAM|nr:hypothetical protein FIBSPDRAFT_860733 [Fibularhizoctonia sp. CBS 109695]
MAERAVSLTTPAAGGGLDSGSELSELTEEEQDGDDRSDNDEDADDGENETEDTPEGNRRRPVRGGGRRKRGGMVPAPMWDWAYKQKKNGDRSATQQGELEEEEEEPTPAERMEEEEDDEEEQASRQTSDRPSNRRNAAGEHIDKEASADWGGAIDEVDHNFFDALSPTAQSKRRSRRAETFSRGSTTRHSVTNGDETDDDEEEVDDEEDADVEEEDGDVPQLNLDAADLGVESESDAEVDVAPEDTPTLKSVAPMDIDVEDTVDVTAPSPSAIAPMVALAAQASIMAGSSILASPTPSSHSSLSGTPASSRSASPAPGKGDAAEGDEDAATTHSPKRLSKKKGLLDDEDPEPLPSVPTVADIKDKLLAKPGEAEDAEAASVVHDELDLEVDADMQPAHRAEALDVLASIELKFALLRERVYVEKMEGIAWEETLIAEGTHPESVYLHNELSRREAKRKEFAARQRTYDMAAVTKKRKASEDYIWGWWKFARDELQTDMVSEHKRKYRRLERDRRALGQPQPVRHIPTLPREVPAPPTLRQIVKSFPYPGNRSHTKKAELSPTPMVYPELSTLTAADIANDLDFLYQHRRMPFDPHPHRAGMVIGGNGSQLGPASAGPPMTPMQQGFDPYMAVDVAPGPSYPPNGRMAPPPPPPQQQHYAGQPPNYAPGMGRPPHQSSGPPPAHGPSPYLPESEMTLVAVGPGHSHQYYGGPGQSGGPSAPHTGASRPISPVHVGGGPGIPGPGKWAGDARISGPHPIAKGAEYGWPGNVDELREREKEIKRDRDRERERTRERNDREREREHFERERENYLMQQQHRHAPPILHQHPHPHNPPPPPPHHHPVAPHHHHRHHHHVVHHHHPQQSGSSAGPPSGPSPVIAIAGPSAVNLHAAPPREFDSGRAHPGPTHQPEVLSLSVSKPSTSSQWKRDDMGVQDYRDVRGGRHVSRPSSTHPAPGIYEDRERPSVTPFAIAPSQGMSASGPPPNGQTSVPNSHSPRNPWSDDHGSRMAVPASSSSYASPLARGSPLGLSPPRSRPPAPRSPSTTMAFSAPMRSPTRYPNPANEPPMHSLSSVYGSATTSPSSKARRLASPPPSKMGITNSHYSPPRLQGPGRTSTPVEMQNKSHAVSGPPSSTFNRTSSPLTTYNNPMSHGQPPGLPRTNGSSNLLPAPKINAVQMVDGP